MTINPFDGLDVGFQTPISERRTNTRTEPPEGVHKLDGEYYKVQVAVHGSGKLYAKVYTPQKGEWVYIGRQAPFWSLSDDSKLTLEQAKEFGHLYGRCCICGRTLTDEASISAGIGPVCSERL